MLSHCMLKHRKAVAQLPPSQHLGQSLTRAFSHRARVRGKPNYIEHPNKEANAIFYAVDKMMDVLPYGMSRMLDFTYNLGEACSIIMRTRQQPFLRGHHIFYEISKRQSDPNDPMVVDCKDVKQFSTDSTVRRTPVCGELLDALTALTDGSTKVEVNLSTRTLTYRFPIPGVDEYTFTVTLPVDYLIGKCVANTVLLYYFNWR